MITELEIEKSKLTRIADTCDLAVKKFLNYSVSYEDKCIKFEHSIWAVLDPINNAIISKLKEILKESI